MMKKEIAMSAGLVVAGAVVGAGTTYLVLNAKLKAHYEAIVEEEIASVKQTFKVLRKEGEYATPEAAVEAIIPKNNPADIIVKGRAHAERIIDYAGYSSKREPEEDTDFPETSGPAENENGSFSVFDTPEVDPEDVTLWDRDPEKPYVISVSEFMTDKMEFDKLTLTYYDEDEVLSDERDTQFRDVDGLIGEDSLGHFGKGSNSPDILYCRNESLNTDFEVIKDARSYSEVILGVKDWNAVNVREPSVPKKMRKHT